MNGWPGMQNIDVTERLKSHDWQTATVWLSVDMQELIITIQFHTAHIVVKVWDTPASFQCKLSHSLSQFYVS